MDIGCGGRETVNTLLKNNNVNHVVGIDYSLDSVSVTKRMN